MFGSRMTMLIMSCDKFSDLWDGHVQLLEQHWASRCMKTYIVTDKKSDKVYENVSVLSAGEDKEWSERLKFALDYVNTEYVFITLDDYFLIEPVVNEKIDKILSIMATDKYDYIRLYLRPQCPRNAKISKYGEFYNINTQDRYSVNLYAGIWRKSFMMKVIREPKNAWQFEVSLPNVANSLGAKCAMSNNKEYVILDVVRKGKLLHKAARYFKKHDIYHGNRDIISIWYEIKLGIRTWGIRLMPKCVAIWARDFMIKRGHHYFSQDANL